MDINELLTAIDTWRAALDDYINTDAGLNPVFAAAKPLTGNEGTQDTLHTMTTLADEIRRLQAENAELQSRMEAAAGIPQKQMESPGDFEAAIWNECLLEFRKALGLGGEDDVHD